MGGRLGLQSELGQIIDDALVKSAVLGFCPAAGLEADLTGWSGSRPGGETWSDL